MSRRARLTTTSYAILGLLAIKPWTTYELTQQMGRSFRYMWPRAESKLYEEPKKLVAHGLARASKSAVGRRRRTIYKITPKGRRELAKWLAEPGDGPTLESEQLLKVFLFEHSSRDAAIANVRAMRSWAETLKTLTLTGTRDYLESGGPFPHRLPQLLLSGRFLSDFADMILCWTAWAQETLEGWPLHPTAEDVDRSILEAIAEQTSATASAT